MRPTPFSLVFDSIAPEQFPAIRVQLAARGLDPRDRDAFLMVPEVAALIRLLRPTDGVGEGMDQLVAFAHHAYLFWLADQPLSDLDSAALEQLLSAEPPSTDQRPVRSAWYIRLPERRVWARVLEHEAHEPLDGCFVHAAQDERLRVLGVFGLHQERDGFSAVETEGPRPGALRRDDSSAPFSTTLPGGASAGLYSLVGAEELLALGWRSAAVRS
jgi:hypothetical protein